VKPGRLSAIVSPEAIASILVAVIAVAIMANQVFAGPTPTPGSETSPGPSSSVSEPAQPTFPPLIRSSLSTLLVVNQRLAEHADSLAKAIAVRAPAADDIAAILRSINTELEIGDQAANWLLTMPDTVALGQALGAFYDTVTARNADTLGASLGNASAYIQGAKQVIKILVGLGPLNERIQAALEGAARTPSPSIGPASPSPSVAPSETPPPTVRPSASPAVGPSASPSLGPSAPAGSGGPFDEGLVQNGGFEDGLTGWQLQVTPPASATATIDPSGGVGGTAAARIDIAATSDSRTGVSLVNGPFGLGQGAHYTISVAVRAAETREIRIRVTGTGDVTYAPRVYTIGPTWTVVSFDLSQIVDDPGGGLALDLGRSAATVWFDNVSLKQSPG
jgi:Carbohydrate binding domain